MKDLRKPLLPTWSPLVQTVGARRYQQCLLLAILTALFIFTFFYLRSTTKLREPPLQRQSENVKKSLPEKPAIFSAEIFSKPTESTVEKIIGKKWNLTACALIHNEVPYLIEWLEFHRLHGVDHFILYTYHSIDLPEYVPLFYSATGVRGLIDLIPARFPDDKPSAKPTSENYAATRQLSMADCALRFGKYSEWLLFSDIGHFTHSFTGKPLPEVISEFRNGLRSEEGSPLGFRVPATYFGATGIRRKFATWLTPNIYTGLADFMYEPGKGSSGLVFPLITEFSGSPVLAPECGTVCTRALDAVIVCGDWCQPEKIKECLGEEEKYTEVSETILRNFVYNWGESLDNERVEFNEKDGNEENKEGFPQWISGLREAILRLKPKVFYDVDRTCQKEALESGQQVECPASHPFPMGNHGTKWLRRCCQTDTDSGGNPLDSESYSCYKRAEIECPQPADAPKWSLRSCCSGKQQ